MFTFLAFLLHDLTALRLNLANQLRSDKTRGESLKVGVAANSLGALLIPFDTAAKPFG